MRGPTPQPSSTDAPSLAQIEAAGWRVTVYCAPCRTLRDVAVRGLIAQREASLSLDALRFRCRCGALGQALVYGAGNLLNGRPIVWPAQAPWEDVAAPND